MRTAAAEASPRAHLTPGSTSARYARHRPEDTVLYAVVEEHADTFFAHIGERGASLPAFVHREFERYLRCGRLEEGFVRVACTSCRHEHLVVFSCKCRGFCPSCGARRMVESAAGLVDHVLPLACPVIFGPAHPHHRCVSRRRSRAHRPTSPAERD